jgi:23S rRNA pseudouridine1911/1915/1917 synthase
VTPTPADILYEDNHLLVVNKPAELATMGAAAGESSLVNWARQYIKQKYEKPGNVYLGVVSRLDSFVTGAVVLARTSKAASRLTRQFEQRTVRKIYWAVIAGRLPDSAGECVDFVRKDDRQRRVVVCEKTDAGAKQAKLSYEVVAETNQYQWLQIVLETGRKHQIRVQLAARQHPIIGDQKYGSRIDFPQGIALHARQLELTHPTQNERVTFTAPVPAAWRELGFEF